VFAEKKTHGNLKFKGKQPISSSAEKVLRSFPSLEWALTLFDWSVWYMYVTDRLWGVTVIPLTDEFLFFLFRTLFYSAHIHIIESSRRLADVLACCQKVSHPGMRLVSAASWRIIPFSLFENFGACWYLYVSTIL
jgi:hypothetical protein